MALVLDEVRQTRDALRYGYAVGKVRVLETRLLDRSAVERLLDARDFAEQKRLLSETPYARHLEDADTAQSVEAALEDALDGFYRFLDEAALPEAVIAFFRLTYDYANLKAALKSRALGVPTADLLVMHGAVPSAVFLGDVAELPEPLRGIAERLAGVEDVAVIDAAVDAAYFAALRDAAHAAGSPYLAVLARVRIDAANVKSLLRSAAAGLAADDVAQRLIDGGDVDPARLRSLAGAPMAEIAEALTRMPELKGLHAAELMDPASLDPATEALVTAALRKGRSAAAGPEPVIAYVMGREAEVRTLRTLLLGGLTGIDDESLRARVSASYR